MQIEEIKDREIWNKFIAEQDFSQFLQSYQWGEFQNKLKRKIWHLAVLDEDKILGAVLIIKHQLPFNKSYLYSPKGPVFAEGKENSKFQIPRLRQGFGGQANSKLLIEKIKEIAKEERSIFWRIEPPILSKFLSKNVENFITKLSVRRSLGEGGLFLIKTQDVQPSKTLILDLEKSKEELLAEMHPKTRYNIRVAQRHGIKILNSRQGRGSPRAAKPQNYFDNFWQLLQETAKRDKFRLHPKIYYQKILETLDNSQLFLAEQSNKIIAANIVIFFDKTATYLHGASDWRYRNLMAPHLLQWQQILEAKKTGFHFYDFWGIDEKKWPGLTRFKKSFGGKLMNSPGTFDLVFDKFWYRFYKLGKFFKKSL